MTRHIVTTLAAALIGLTISAGAGRAGEECDNTMENIEDAVQTASKVLEQELAELTKKKPENEGEKQEFRVKYCSSTGEFLGISRIYRLMANECLRGSKRRETTSSLDESIKSLEKSLRDTCN